MEYQQLKNEDPNKRKTKSAKLLVFSSKYRMKTELTKKQKLHLKKYKHKNNNDTTDFYDK